MAKSTVKTFVEQFVALVKGDEAAATAAKVERQRIAALNTAFHNANGDLVDKEQRVQDAEDYVVKCRLNHGREISNRQSYVSNLIAATEKVKDAQEALEAHQLLISTLKAEIDM